MLIHKTKCLLTKFVSYFCILYTFVYYIPVVFYLIIYISKSWDLNLKRYFPNYILWIIYRVEDSPLEIDQCCEISCYMRTYYQNLFKNHRFSQILYNCTPGSLISKGIIDSLTDKSLGELLIE